MKGVILSVFAMLALIQFIVQPGEAITCGQVDVPLAACLRYLTLGGEPGPACCYGVRSIKGLAQTPEDKKAVCNCVKSAANRYPTLKDDAAMALPEKCGITMDIPISRTINCDIIS